MSNKGMGEDLDIENVGIMQGFMDSMSDDDDDDDEDEGAEEEGDEDERRPNSPEILMNNLRGDMRSIDARRDELADLVGYAAAAETPETVLAMLQPILAQGGGLAALPQSAPMIQGPQPPALPPMPPGPPPGGIPPMAPPGAPPGGPPMPPPLQMANGGYVQRFQEGSDEDGVTPREEPSSLGFAPSPEMVEQARMQMMNLLAQKPLAVPDLQQETARRAQVYRNVLGDSRDARQAQMLMSLGQRAFNFAGNVDDQGRALRGSFVSRLAGAARTLPGEMAGYISAMDKEQRQIKLMGLQAAEKEIAGTKEQNLKLLESQRRAFGDILKADAQARKAAGTSAQKGFFGTGATGGALNLFYQKAEDFAKGLLSPEEERAFLTAVTEYTQPTYVTITDHLTNQTRQEERRKELPAFVVTALKTRNMSSRGRPANKGAAGATRAVPQPASGTPGASVPTEIRKAPTSPAIEETPLSATTQRVAPTSLPDEVVKAAPQTTFFDLASTGTGFAPVIISGIARNVPLSVAGQLKPEYQQATTALESMSNRVVNVLQENPRFAEGERKQIMGELDLAPRMLDNKQSYINRIAALDNVLSGIEEKTRALSETLEIGTSKRNEAYRKLEDIKFVRDLLGVQSRKINTPQEWAASPPGEYLVYDPNNRIYVYRQKKGAK